MDRRIAWLIVILCFIIPVFGDFPGYCLDFDGSNDVVQGNGIPQTFGNEVTLEAWVYHRSTGSTKRYITLKSEAAVIRHSNGGDLNFYVKQSNGTLTGILAPDVVVTGQWFHVAGTYDGSILRLYMNGELLNSASAPVGGFTQPDGEFELSSGGETMDGYIDEARVWDTCRTAEEIIANKNHQLNGAESGLVACWRLDETSGNMVYDAAGSADGVMVNMTTGDHVPSGVPVFQTEAGTCLDFDGANDYVALAQNNGLPIYQNGNQLTISAWVRAAEEHDVRIYSESLTSDSDALFTIGCYYGGKLRVFIRTGSGTVICQTVSDAVVFDNTWHHITYTDNNGDAHLFVDGTEDSADFSYTRQAISFNRSSIGAIDRGTADHFIDGRIDEVHIYNRALSASEASAEMLRSCSGTEDGLVSCYAFNEGSGTNAYDPYGGNNGILMNMDSPDWVASDIDIGQAAAGHITSDTVWSAETVYICGEVTVDDGVTLTVEPGTTVEFTGHYKLNVQGRILAEGTDADSIRFTADPATGWHGIRFYNTPTTNDSSKFVHCVMENGQALGSGYDAQGGAMFFYGYDKVLVRKSSIRNNSTQIQSSYGGAIRLIFSDPLFVQTEFRNNSSGSAGGAIGCYESTLNAISCTFSGNTTLGTGGALSVIYSSAGNLTSCLFEGNQSGNSGGAIHCNGSLNLLNCTVVDNNGSAGGGIALSSGSNTIRNSIIRGNTSSNGDQVWIGGSSNGSDFTYSNIEGGSAAFGYSGGSWAGVYEHCMDRDPLFQDAAGGDYDLGDYSPCANGGDPTTNLSGWALVDVAGFPRYFDNSYATGSLDEALDRIDIGAYESSAQFIIPDGTVIDEDQTLAGKWYIHPGFTVTVDPGVTMRFYTSAGMIVYGNLLAAGTPADPIVFTRASEYAIWEGLLFEDIDSGFTPSSTFENCTIEYGDKDSGVSYFNPVSGSWSSQDEGANVYAKDYDALDFTNCVIREGHPNFAGGGLYLDNSAASLINCLICDNEGGSGPALFSDGSDVTMINCTVSGNTTRTGYYPIVKFENITAQPVITNTIIYGNEGTALSPGSGTLTDISYSVIEGTYPGDHTYAFDPQFEGTGDHPYRPKPASFCLNMGTPDTSGLGLPSVDLAGEPRIFGHETPAYDRIDIGAYEVQSLHGPANFTASDGNNNYPGYVQLSWSYNPDYDPVPQGFRIFRGGSSINVIDGQTYAYSDYTAVPGQVYEYYVQAFYQSDTGNSDNDSGYMKPNGIISGTVLSSNNNPVAGVKVSLDPSPGYCVGLTQGISSLAIGNPGVNMNNNFTLECWVRTQQTGVNLLNRGSHHLRINGAGELEHTDGTSTLTQSSAAVTVNDNDWHHIAVVNNYTEGIVRLYADGLIVAESTAFLFAGSSASPIDASFTGYIDDIRIWSAARDSSQIAGNMSIVAAWDSPGLDGYWTLNEGTGTAVYDATNNANNGFLSGAAWSDLEPGIELGAYTDSWGDYLIGQIYYGASTTFTVTPYKPGHIFQPEQRQVTLSESNIAVNNVDFTDNSLIPITGRVTFQGTDCPVAGASILLNGEHPLPVVTTGADGYYTLEVEHGTSCIVSAENGDHIFNRQWDLGEVTFPQTDIDFEDTYKTQFRLEVVGGSDHWPIGEFDATVASVNGCFYQEITGENWATGGIMINNLPPLEYNVTVDPAGDDPFDLAIDEQFQSNKTQTISLTSPEVAQDTLLFVWRAPMQIQVAWPDTLETYTFPDYPDAEFYVLQQNQWYGIEISAFEDYSFAGHADQVTWLTDCDVAIHDEVGTQGDTDGEFGGSNTFTYTFAPYLPNTLSGYDRQYQNLLEVTVSTSRSARNNPDERSVTSVSHQDWVFTEGVRPLESTYSTTSPEIPFLILHDPPGDGSFASFSQSSSHSVAFTTSVCTDNEHNVFERIHLGPDLTFEAGSPFFSVETEVDITADFELGLTMQTEQEESTEQSLTFTTTEEYTTSEEDQVIGGGSDLFVGGALNLVWGVTNEVSFDYQNQAAIVDTSVMVTPDGFATVYIYTDNQIRNTVIPNLITIGDQASADLWQEYLDQNETNKSNAVPNPNHPGNVSFNAGAGYTYEEETESSQTQTIEFETTVSTEFGAEIGTTVNGVGGELGYTFRTEVSLGSSEEESFETVSTTSFTLADDDETSELNELADYFTVDVKVDPVYGTPVFDLIAGASSCPWEPGTMPREGVAFSANTYTASDIQQGQEAVFLLQLGNTSQTGEDRRYFLTVDHGTNTGGATVKINGVPLEDAMAFDVPGGQTVQATMTVEQGPEEYEYEGLTLEFYSEGDRGNDGPDGHYFDVYRSFDITWEAPYSRVAIGSPVEGWIVNQTAGDSLDILLRDYDLTKPGFKSLKMQYKHPGDEDWMPGFEIFKADLEDDPHTIVHPWDLTSIPDGVYQIRACATDSVLAEYQTDPISGIIDRAAPVVLGNPEPADGIMGLGDEISVSFNELLDPQTVTQQNTTLTIINTSQVIACNVACFDNKIVLTPGIETYWIENMTLQVSITGLKDIYGNQITVPVEWEFFVNANPVGWDIPKLEVTKPLGETLTLTAQLVNSGGQTSSFSIQNLPVWLTASPMTGTLSPLDQETVTFTVSNQLGFGDWNAVIEADIPSLGAEPLEFDIAVQADPPAWSTIPVTGYDYSMTITGQLSIDGALSADPSDIVGAFVEDGAGGYECRGFAHTELVPYFDDTWQFFLTIHSNAEMGEDIVLRTWDASECKEHIGSVESFGFLDGAVIGTPVTPQVVHVSSELVRSIDCTGGWTWLSTNLENQSSMNVNDLLAGLNPVTGDLIKNQTGYAQYTPGVGWVGNLTTVFTTETLKLKLTQSDELILTGLLEEPLNTPVSYGSGWNWIGYIPHISIAVNQALAGIPNLVTGDLVKNQSGYAQYIAGYGWAGSLLFMNPGDGFMLHTQNAGSFTYPEYDITREGATPQRPARPLPEVPGWELDPLAYEYTANLTAIVTQDGLPLDMPGVVAGVFHQEQCRGMVEALDVLDSSMFFLTMYGNVMGEELELRLWYPDTQETVSVGAGLQFVPNQILGNPLEPYEISLPSGELDAPQNVQIQMIAGAVMLSWDSVDGASSYNVYTADNPALPLEQWTPAATGIAATTWTDASPGESKFYIVTASTDTPTARNTQTMKPPRTSGITEK